MAKVLYKPSGQEKGKGKEPEREIALEDVVHELLSGPNGEGFAVLMAMPDEQFSVLAPFLLQELQSSLAAPENVIQLAHELNALGIKVEDINEDFSSIYDILVKQNKLSQTKADFFKLIITMMQNAANQTEAINHRILGIPTEFCDKNAKMPTYAHPNDAGADVYAPYTIELGPGESTIVKTGLKMEIPVGYAVLVTPRSGVSAKTKLRISNAPGTINLYE